ncbi:hypothetical protein MSG28_014930 [Choristoneura fumiferana]|uniref:Uncharacterized protein n=1 Tax=Choristoneura fumiferana TaxID=7141 RepID=A0ACC0KYD5_CHOFU|nr:hypothetical protein MSG28_014930 [Choristoneura fumiferana]
MKILSTLLVGVLLPLATIAANQSGGDSLEIQPMREPAFLEGKRQLETPEVVLQLKYDRGELNRIYLAQFRKNKEAWMPSVPATDSLCSDLCHAGRPLCQCEAPPSLPVAWAEVCAAFCLADNYVLGGCPPCAALTAESSAIAAHAAVARVLTTAEGWTAWCNAQCRQGQGGAACNCDRAPSSKHDEKTKKMLFRFNTLHGKSL